MSLDNFFDRLSVLEKRTLVEFTDSFVATTNVTAVWLPIEALPAVQYYYPDYQVEDWLDEIRVSRGGNCEE